MTKLLPLALAAFALTAGAAFADNTFSVDRARSTDSALALTNVQADLPGRVEVYAYDGERATSYLGQARVEAGTTDAVEVALNQPARGRILVVLSNGNHSVATLDTEAPLTN